MHVTHQHPADPGTAAAASPANPTALYALQTIRRVCLRAGLDPKMETASFVSSGYSRAYLTDLSERARRARMARQQPGGAA